MPRVRIPGSCVVSDHHAVRVPVALGVKGDGKVEILEGVAAGDRVVAASPGVRPGAWIRIASTANARGRP